MNYTPCPGSNQKPAYTWQYRGDDKKYFRDIGTIWGLCPHAGCAKWGRTNKGLVPRHKTLQADEH